MDCRNKEILEATQKELTRLIGVAEACRDTCTVNALLQAKMDIAKKREASA